MNYYAFIDAWYTNPNFALRYCLDLNKVCPPSGRRSYGFACSCSQCKCVFNTTNAKCRVMQMGRVRYTFNDVLSCANQLLKEGALYK